MLIKIHSFTDIITNSSTTVYSHLVSNGVEMVKELINEVLQSASSDKTVEDLFEIKEIYNGDAFFEAVFDEPEEYFTPEDLEQFKNLDWKEGKQFISLNLEKEMQEYYQNYYEYESSYNSSISIISKTNDKSLGNLINSLFSTYAIYNG